MVYTVGIDIGGTKIAAGLVSEDGQIIKQARHKTPRTTSDDVLDIISEMVTDFRAEADEEVVGVGVGVPGLVEADHSTIILVANLGWEREPFRERVEKATALPATVENDANAAAWAEYRFGAGQGHQEMIMVTVGTGVGGGIVVGGKLRRGAGGTAGEFGHLNMVPDGRQCACGLHGCWEQYASGNALTRRAREIAAEKRGSATLLLSLGDGTPEGVEGIHVSKAAAEGDPVALETFAEVGEWLGRGIADLAALFDPAVFVIGGGVVESGDLLMRPVVENFERYLVARNLRTIPPILPAQMGNTAGLVGAADLIRVQLDEE